MPGKLSLTRVGFAVPFLLLTVLLAVGTFTEFHPTGLLQKTWQNIVSFAPMQPGEAGNDPNLGPWQKRHGIVYGLDFQKAVRHARKTGRPLLLDFTGVNCVNCRKMEYVIGDSPLKKRLADFVSVQLYTDELPDADKSGIKEEDAEELLDFNRRLQQKWFGDVQLPAYAVVRPDDLEVLKRFEGLTSDYEVFEEFLNDGMQKWKSPSNNKPVQSASRSSKKVTANR